MEAVVVVEAAGARGPGRPGEGGAVTDFEQLSTFHHALAEMCRGGVPLGKAIRTLEADLRNGALRDAVREMSAEVEAGAGLAEAYRRRAAVFPSVYGSLIEAGVASGDLPGTLEEISRHAAMRADASLRLRRVAAYPAALLVCFSLVCWFLFSYILPQIADMFERANRPELLGYWGQPKWELPLVTRFFLAVPLAGFLIPGLAVAVFVVYGYLRSPLDGLRVPLGPGLRLPFIGPVRLHAGLMIFTSTLALLLRRGLALDRALELAAAAADLGPIRSAAAGMAARVREGSGFCDAARSHPIFPSSTMWILSAGEAQGRLPEALEDMAGIHGDRYRRGMDVFTWAVEPAFHLVAGGIILAVLIAVYLPFFRMTRMLLFWW